MMPAAFLSCQGSETITCSDLRGYGATMGCVLRRGVVVILLACVSACAAKGGTPRPFPAPPSVAVPPEITAPAAVSPSGAFSIQSLLDTALGYRGVPYRNGGSDPTGFDCSGFVQWVFAQHGIRLPREVRDQYQYGTSIDRDDVKPGDLVFFETVSRGASHVGIAVGADQFVHAPSSRGVVRVESYTVEYWKGRYVGARRLP
jgi:cell wall-associated NlpC family hydrolase